MLLLAIDHTVRETIEASVVTMDLEAIASQHPDVFGGGREGVQPSGDA